jgi:putative SOS response-associated peptidase YedK
MAGLFLEATKQPPDCDVPITGQKFISVTTAPDKSVGRFHNRMPLIVQPGIT